MILLLLFDDLLFPCFTRKSTMTMNYCDVFNWSVGDKSFSVHYKSLVISFPRKGAHWTVGGAGVGTHLTLPQVCLPWRGCCQLLKKEKRTSRQESCPSPDLPVCQTSSSKLANLSGIRSALLRASKTASPFSRTIPLLFHLFVGAVSQCGLYMYL